MIPNLIKKQFQVFLLLLILTDCFYSFNQFYHTKLDGDIARGVVPEENDRQILKDPFGYNVLVHNKRYVGTNRFFLHCLGYKYFRTVPFILQKFVSPIDSIYLSAAIFKLFTQLLLLFLIASYMRLSMAGNDTNYLLMIILIIPLFQAYGYNNSMGVIDKSVSYTTAYAFPMACLLLYFLPFYIASVKERLFEHSIGIHVLICVGAIILAFNSPIILGIILVICTMVLLSLWKINFAKIYNQPFIKKLWHSFFMISAFYLWHFIFVFILCIYSFYIGLNNIENFTHTLSLADRYAKIPLGLYNLLTQKIGLPLLLLMIFANLIVIKKMFYSDEGKTILKLSKWIGIFSLLYVCLIPLGGFRIYRPNILRYDTIIPITIALIFLYGLSTYFLLNRFYQNKKWIYAVITFAFLLIYVNADKLKDTDYVCERKALTEISLSDKDSILLTDNCSVLAWEKTNTYQKSELNAQLLLYWNITKRKKVWYQK